MEEYKGTQKKRKKKPQPCGMIEVETQAFLQMF